MEQKPTHPKHTPTPVGERLMNYSAVSLLIGIVLIALSFFSPYFGKDCYVMDQYKISGLTHAEFEKMNTTELEGLRDKYASIYNNRKEHYVKSSGALSTTVNALGICCLISILALYYEKRDSISIAGIQLPFKSVFLILPVLMLYLWLSFGFTYFSALDSRQICYVSAVKYERTVDRLNSRTTKVDRPFSMIHNLEDMGIVDGSVHVFNGLYSNEVYDHFYYNHELHECRKNDRGGGWISIQERPPLYWVVGVSLYLIFGTLLGISVGFIVTLLIRFQHLKDTNTLYAKCLVFTVFVLLCLSFAGFIMTKPYFLPFLGYIWIIAAVVIYVYVVRLRKRPELE
ncbi:MAG TPA: hypothetical protein VK151_16465 [Fluviicola sp.]|nr:hypothetical protein [Fluviicola sp.]